MPQDQQQLRATFEEIVEKYVRLFGLENWKIAIVYHPNNVPGQNLTGLDDMRIAKTLADPMTYVKSAGAETKANPIYNQAVITIYPRLLEQKDLWEETIVHELIHIVMALYDFYTDNMCQDKDQPTLFTARENSVSVLTAIIMRVREGGNNAN